MRKLYFFLLIPVFSFAQTAKERQQIENNSNVAALHSLSAKETLAFRENKKKAMELAAIYHWQLVIETDSTYSELMGVTKNNSPIYFSTSNRGAGITSRANKLYNGGGLGLSIQGENMIVAVWDAGAGRTTHELFSGRLQVMDNAAQTHPHATHVAGTIIGTDAVQNGIARGMAFKAIGHSYEWSDDLSEVAAAAAQGLLLSNHSYGINADYTNIEQWGKYDQEASTVDEIMFEAPYYQYVCAAGNSQGYNADKNGFDLLSGHSTSKNAMVVAAVYEVLNYTGPASVQMSWFSSWGPTDDGRIKPDISAKGVNTYSSIDESDTSYAIYSGTSMASPSVTGTLLLLQQYYNQKNGSFMKAATLRGLAIHTADEAGSSPGPDYSFGWGLINAEKAATVITKDQLQSYILQNTLAQGDTFSIPVKALGNGPLIATLCWTDPQGAPSNNVLDNPAPALVNDLDVRITQADATFYPWKLDPANPTAAAVQGDNVVDNVEKVQVNDATGNYIVTVSHKGTLVNNLQDYSLIISGNSVKPFWFTTAENTVAVCTTSGQANFNFTFSTQYDFNETVTFSVNNLPAGVTAAFNPVSMTAAGNFSLTLGNLSSIAPGTYNLIVHGESASNAFELPVTLNIYNTQVSAVSLVSPVDNSTTETLPVTLAWNDNADTLNYEVDVASDAAFTDIIYTATTTSTGIAAENLNNSTTYFWRVRSLNSCTASEFSIIRSFTTACASPSQPILINATTTTLTIGWTGDINASNTHILCVGNGVTPTGNGVLASTNPFMITDLQTSNCYDIYLRSNCSNGDSTWAGPFTFCTQPDYCGGEHFYDTGGSSFNYSNNEDKVTTIFPGTNGYRVKAVFNSFSVEDGFDFLKIYDGPDTSSALIFEGTGTNSPGTVVSTHPGGALTFHFTSDQFVSESGWDADIICEPQPVCGEVPTDLSLIVAGPNSATVQWTQSGTPPGWEVQVVPQNTSPGATGTVVSQNPYTFVNLQPGTCYDFYVRVSCEAGVSEWVGPLNFCTQADYCGQHFYDTGGADGDYAENEDYVTVIYPDASGQRIKAIFNSFSVESGYDFLKIYNGPDINSPLLYSGTGTDMPSTVASTDNTGALTFQFTSDYSNNASGWDASIVCEPFPLCQFSPVNLSLAAITSTTATVGWTDGNGAASWEIQLIPDDGTPAGSGSVISTNPYTFTALSAATCYKVYIRSICNGGDSDWVGPFRFCTQPDYCAGSHFYDTGGADGNYSDNEDYITVIHPGNPGDRVKVTFNSFSLEDGYDSLLVYNGPDTSYPLLNLGTGTTILTTMASTDPSGALTFHFKSDGSQNDIGWDASIICEPMPPCSYWPSNVTEAGATSSSVTVSWDDANAGPMWEVETVPQGNPQTGIGTATAVNPFTITGLNANTCYDVYVRTLCGSANSYWIGPLTVCTQLNYCEGQHFYDSGGANGNYGEYEDSVTTIYPETAGYFVSATFESFQLEDCCDYFKIYDGPDTSYPLLFSGNGSNSPGTITAANATGALTFTFTSDGDAHFSGWDAEIGCTMALSTDHQVGDTIEYYPNPVIDKLQVDSPILIDTYEIYDAAAKLLFSGKISQKNFGIPFSSYSSGLYFVKLTSDDGSSTHMKIMKK
jgi:hypothetical protein